MSTVQTIRGPIDSAALGRALTHEHLTNGSGGMEHIPGLLDRDEMVARCVAALERVKRSGIDTILDVTPLDLGRQIWLFERVAERVSDVNVVCATGVYRWVPAIYFNWDEDEIADFFVREIRDGIEGTGIRAGIIKLAWDLEYRLTEGQPRSTPRAMLERTARAAARAAKATGVPITCHTRAVDGLGTPLLDIFADEGLDLAAVTIGHSNDTQDMSYLTSLAARGANVGLDRFFSREPDYVAQRGEVAMGMIRAGYAEQISLGHDGAAAGLWGRWQPQGNPEVWCGVPDVEVPWLLAHGATDDNIDAAMRRSTRRTFEAGAASRRQ